MASRAGPEFDIRRASVADAARLAAIERDAGELFRTIGMDAVADDPVPSVDEFRSFLAAGRAWVAVDEDDTAVGYVLVDVVDRHAHLEQVSVLPSWSRRGIGRALVEQAMAWAAEAGFSAVTLTTFTDVAWNGPYYQRLGFRYLDAEEIGPELHQIRLEEARKGLDAWPRGCMVRAVDVTDHDRKDTPFHGRRATVTDLQPWVGATYDRLADLLAASAGETWEAPSLCDKWQVRHVIAHVTMPARLTPEQFGAEMAAAGGDFNVLSDTVAARDASLPAADLLDQLRSQRLHEWQPPGGGAAGALSHAVIHSLDVTIPLGRPAVAPGEAVTVVLDQLTAANGAWFGVDLTGVRLEADDTSWSWGDGDTVRANSGSLVALLSGRTLPDGRTLPSR